MKNEIIVIEKFYNLKNICYNNNVQNLIKGDLPMKKVLIAPSKYIQGEGEIDNIGEYINNYSKNAIFLMGGYAFKNYKEGLELSCNEKEITAIFDKFNGECSREEVDRIINLGNEIKEDCVIVGIGGGKVLDTAKAVAYYLNSPVIIVPTIASTDAPCSALSVLYTPSGEFSEYLILRENELFFQLMV